MFNNLAEGRKWLEKQRYQLSKFSAIADTGEYFILVGDNLKKVPVIKVSTQKITFGQCDYKILSEVSVFRKQLSDKYKVIPLEKVQEFKNALERIQELHNLEYKAIAIADRLAASGFKRIKELSPQLQQKFVDLFSEY